jgi:G3E family GTPase
MIGTPGMSPSRQTADDATRTPVSVVTGFLGAGKTTLIRHLLAQREAGRIAVIENEFGPDSIDAPLLGTGAVDVIPLNNGCLCCTLQPGLLAALAELDTRRAQAELEFDRVIIETTGLADPGPVIQGFFHDTDTRARYRLDAVLTLVDAVHAQTQLDRFAEARVQIARADRLLITRHNLVDAQQLDALVTRLARINPGAMIVPVDRDHAEYADLLDLYAYETRADAHLSPYYHPAPARHSDDIRAFVIREIRPYDRASLEYGMSRLIEEFAPDLLRYKGILSLAGHPQRVVFQGLHHMLGGEDLSPWAADEARESLFVFIGRALPETAFRHVLNECLAN